MENTQHSLFGRTCPEHLAATKERTLNASSKHFAASKKKEYQFLDLREDAGVPQERSWVTATASRGGSSTRNTGECPSVVSESTLWQILQANAPEKYYLSARACDGIMRRADRRGKEMPPILREALEEAVALGV